MNHRINQARLANLLAVLEDMAAGHLERRAPISPAHDELDALAYTVNVLIGELDFTVRRLKQAERDAQEANQQKSLFLRNVSHELRTPLAAIQSYNRLIQDKMVDPDIAAAADRIQANCGALGALIEDLLDLTRVEAGKLAVTLGPVSPTEVAADVVQSLLPEARAKGLTLQLALAPEVPARITSDPRRLRQILMNLVGNAVKFTDRGGIIVSLRVEARPRQLIIDVTDTGVGLGLADQGRLFSTFMQADTGLSKVRGGVGLGLVLARQLAGHLGGELGLVTSQVDEGSQFRLTFPIADQVVEPPPPAPPRQTPRLEGLGVLFVEDNADILSSYARLLEIAGCTVDKATNGLDAISQGSAKSFDVILMDMQMPICDGLEATRRLRQAGCKTPILALSAHAMAEDRQRFIDAGCTDHIAKPIDIEDLLVRLAGYKK